MSLLLFMAYLIQSILNFKINHHAHYFQQTIQGSFKKAQLLKSLIRVPINFNFFY